MLQKKLQAHQFSQFCLSDKESGSKKKILDFFSFSKTGLVFDLTF